MKKNNIILAFLLFSSLVAVDGNCYENLPDVSMLYYSGELANTMCSCSDVCGSYKQIGITYNESVKFDDLCFCRVLAGAINEVQKDLNCNCGVGLCKDFTVGDVRILPSIVTTLFVLDQPTKIKVIGVEESEYIQYDFGDGHTHVTNKSKVEHSFLTPGFFLFKVDIKKNDTCILTTERMIFIKSDNIIITFNVPLIIEKLVDLDYLSLVIAGGSNLKLRITSQQMVENTINKMSDDVFSDVLVSRFGVLAQGDFEAVPVQHDENLLIIVPSITFTESGSITSFEFIANETGVLAIYILRPNCECCVACNENVSLMENGIKSSDKKLDDQMTFSITKVIMININTTGLQLHHLQTTNIKVNQGDILSFTESLSNAKLTYGLGPAVMKLPNPTDSFMQGATVGPFVEEENKLPYLQAYVSKVMTYDLNKISYDTGTINIVVDEINPNTSFVIRNLVTLNASIVKQEKEMKDIGNLVIDPIGNVSCNTAFHLGVQIFNGTDVRIEVDFGISQIGIYFNNTDYIEDASGNNGTKVSFIYMYLQCGRFMIHVTAKNNLTSKFETREVYVACKISDLTVTTTPLPNINNEVKISFEEELRIDIVIAIGSFAFYNISWGDGLIEYIHHTGKFTPEKVTVSHQYTNRMEYELIVSVKNDISFQIIRGIHVKVQNCTEPPPLRFVYGKEDNPIIIHRGKNETFNAYWNYQSNSCRTLGLTNFKWKACEFEGMDIPDLKKTDLENGLSCMIEERQLGIGEHRMTLSMKYLNEIFKYNVSIEVVQSNLTAHISNGNFQTVSKVSKVKRDVPAGPYIYSFNGNNSKDPDEPNTKEGMKFEWFCRIKWPGIMPSNFCNVSSYSDENSWFPLTMQETHCIVERPESELKINSTCFVLNTSFIFMLIVSKQSGNVTRRAETEQEIQIIDGDIPSGRITCQSNCMEKINILDKVIMRFECHSCFGRKIIASWKLFEFNTKKPKEFSASNLVDLVIQIGELDEGVEYDLSGRFHFVGLPDTFVSQTKLFASKIPYGGYCEITPPEGVALQTYFKISCSGWKSGFEDDGAVTYRFYYDKGFESNVEEEKDLHLLDSTNPHANELNVQLLSGLQKLNFVVTVKIRIKNIYGSYAEWNNCTVKVLPLEVPSSEGTGPPSTADYYKCLGDKKPSILDDTQAITNYVISCSWVLQTLPPAVITTLEPTAKPGVFSDAVGNGAQREREKDEKEKERKEKMEFKEMLVTLMANVPVGNVEQFKIVFDAFEAVTKDPEEVSENSKEIASNVIHKMSDKLMSIAKDPSVGAKFMETSTKNYVNSISNLMDVKPKKSSDNKTSEQDAEIVGKLIDSLDNYMEAISISKVPGEAPSNIITSAFTISLYKSTAADFEASQVLVKPDSDVCLAILPNMTGLFDSARESGEDISTSSVSFKNNVYTWGNGSDKIKSEVISISIKTATNVVDVSNLTDPIIINVNNKVEDIEAHDVSLPMPDDLKFYKTEVEECNMLINFDFINDFDNLTQLIVYIQYGKVASVNDHDVKLNMSNTYGMVMTVSAEVPISSNSTDNNGLCNSTHEEVPNERKVYVHKVDERTIILWNFTKYYWANTCKLLHMTFSYNGEMPKRLILDNPYTFDDIEYGGSMNYTMRSFCMKCVYRDINDDKWPDDGCTLSHVNSSLYMTSCLCNHLTSFGGFLVAPNPIRTPTVGMLKEGYALLVTVITILLLYIVVLIIARRADNDDWKKVGMCPLIDNNPADNYMYEIIVETGSQRSAGTKSNIFFNASGDICDSGVHHLTDPEREPFQSGHSDVFVMATPNTIGDINYIRIWHDNTGGSWYLRSVKIIDLQTDEKFMFSGTRWLAVDKNDGMVDCIIPVCTADEMSGFNYIFANKSSEGLSDTHIWYSVYARPPRSSFTRCQRLSVAVSLLFCSMLASCMFYGVTPSGPVTEENRIGNFSFRWEQVFIAIISGCIVAPINIILVGLFRVIDFTQKNKSIDERSVTDANSTEDGVGPTQASGNTKLLDNEKSNAVKKKKKKSFLLPHWCLYLTWLLCILVILICCCLVILYGMTFGNKKSLDWLASVTISLLQDIIIIQPFKVFAFAIFIALVIKRVDDDDDAEEKSAKSLSQDESWLQKFQNDENIFDRVEVCEPPDMSKLLNMRDIRLKEMRMSAITREILLYLLFILLVMAVGFNFRDQNAYNQTIDIKELLRLSLRDGGTFEEYEIFEDIKSYQDFWDWADTVLLTQMYPKKWYDLSERFENSPKKDFPGRVFLNDLNAKLVNGVRLRQMRVARDSCDIDPSVRDIITIDCADSFSSSNEETQDFDFNWNIPLTGEYITPLNPMNKPWRYQDSDKLDTYPIMAKLNTYSGGGYVVELFPKFNNHEIMALLKELQWIDRHTRAVIIEFATYNAQTNFFDMVAIIFEFPPLGGVVHYSSVETFRLEMYTQETKFFVILTYVLYLLFMIIFFIRESRILYRTGWNYFCDFWNLVELGIVVLSILAVVFFFYLGHLKKKLFSRLPHKVPNVFINFHMASIWYDYLIHIIALICFFVIIKLIKMLRFNQRISLLSATLKSAWYPLAMFGFMFIIILASVVFSTTIIFGHSLYGYRNWWGSLSSVFALLLGKFSYYQFETTNRNLGPIFFFAFNIMVNWIIMNMFIAILNDVFAEVQSELLGQDNEYEIIDYMMGTAKTWLGFKDTTLEEIDDDSSTSSQSSRCSSENSLNKIQHDMDEKLFTDNNFLTEEVGQKFVNETLDNFVRCINVIYFR